MENNNNEKKYNHLLEVEDLNIYFDKEKKFKGIENISFTLDNGERLGIVGESGSGKSLTSQAIMGILAENLQLEVGTLKFEGKDMKTMSDSEKREVVGKKISMIFQDPITSLNPVYNVQTQLKEVLELHMPHLSDKEMNEEILNMLKEVGIPDSRNRLYSYPHQLSGGMSQRILIAMALLCHPQLVFADEPSTALDVTIQAQIIDLILSLQEKNHSALVFISHDLALVGNTVENIMVMYAGQIMEYGKSKDVLYTPSHPYTYFLLKALPENASSKRIYSIPGIVPSMKNKPTHCLLAERCEFADKQCFNEQPPLIEKGGRKVRCFKPL